MKLDTVEICKDFSREDIIKKFEELKQVSDEFEAIHKDDYQAVLAIYINWIGHYVDISK